ncbi:hypothetical protein SCHPADRAFT_872384 [Schizopora paradoxa]|uniref:Sister chromatid cohesion protein Dcc1 n=1 Tax=Schizopora paradoxa TaxID=27342 RepID=A0A0H2RRL3_9AGAM|nr:hypothetical protein SCHPADRAFT_872384 [Schizopora paradoxa]
MPTFNISFPSRSDEGKYKLLELPKELVALIESNIDDNSYVWSLSIRGTGEDDAVLCTGEKTYLMKAVTLSNAYCILTPSQEDGREAVISDTVKQIVELSPTIPKTFKIKVLLRDQIYEEGREEVDSEVQTKWKSHSDVRRAIQASDKELEQALRSKRILNLNGYLRPLAPSYLNTALELMLNTLVSLNAPKDSVPVVDLVEVLQSDHDISRDVMLQIMAWFGELGDALNSISQTTTWKMDVHAVARQIGLGILSRYREASITTSEFTSQWRTALGDSFEAAADLALLKGNYIRLQATTLKYFSAEDLPATPQERFADLFLTKSSWELDEITPFLEDIATDNKERDKLLMKYTRSVDRNGTVTYVSARGGPTG